MKSKAYMDELRMKDAQELENELMAAKKPIIIAGVIQTVRTLLTAKEGK